MYIFAVDFVLLCMTFTLGVFIFGAFHVMTTESGMFNMFVALTVYSSALRMRM